MGPEYSCGLRPELARNWSAASHRRFSSALATVSFSEGAIPCMQAQSRNQERPKEFAGISYSYRQLPDADCIQGTPTAPR